MSATREELEKAWNEGYLAHEENSRAPIGSRRTNPYRRAQTSGGDNYIGPYGSGNSQPYS